MKKSTIFMTARMHTEYVGTFNKKIAFFTAHNRKPLYLRLDNETSAPVETYLKQENIKLQHCPPGQHSANIAERCIQTSENHAISKLADFFTKPLPVHIHTAFMPPYVYTPPFSPTSSPHKRRRQIYLHNLLI